ncbi:G1 family glutamic endopeptidase [Paenibacillus cremeus]|uniref:G1 family glutamic endopeptidase n=1 Tax=Paenibacillus cremeus TaxID=2163881 RepID=UPI0021BDD09E|nr:G1 family glutamic endopeptidase [Paenibacillus cremeus]
MTKKIFAPYKPVASGLFAIPAVHPGWKSGNWSGYALKKAKKNSFYSISGYWIVPRVKPSKQNKYSSVWIGIDGFNNASLIQTGTEQDYVNGKAVYYPWWEILPEPETTISLPVSPNDLMFAKISKLNNSTFAA